LKFAVEWMREFVEITISPAELATRLTSVGFVVDTIEGAGDTAILDVDVPPNRPDGMNVYGLAREVAALSSKTLYSYPAAVRESAGAPPASAAATVAIEAADLCGRYCARVVRNIRVAPSPDWIVRRLGAIGLTPVNNVVDITNYVLWELGHPLHAFDLTRLEGRRIVVRRAHRGETIQTLDGVARRLEPEMLVIADATKAVAVAGVMGGAGTMISAGTTEVLLESAWFEPSGVRRTSKRLALSTDASYRFERGADIEVAHVAIDRAAALLAELAGGEVAPGLIDIRAEGAMAKRTIHLRTSRIETLTGMRIEPQRTRKYLEALGFEAAAAPDGFEVVVPRHRQDVSAEADLVEEVARSAGYDAIPETIPHLPGTGAVNRFAHRREETLRSSLLGSGYSEAMTYSFISSDDDWLLREEGVAGVPLTNPMAEGQEILRSTLLPGLTMAARHNLNHGVREVRLFEIGRVFRRVEGRAAHEDRKHAPGPETDEQLCAGIVATGLARARHWSEPARESGFHDVKGAIEEALQRLSLRATFELPAAPNPFRPGSAARMISDGVVVGRVGLLGEEVAARFGIKAQVALAEINLSLLFAAPATPLAFRPIPRFPASSRDLALVVGRETAWRDIESAISEAGGDLVARVALFDRYEGKSLPEGHISVAVNIVYQHPDRTLALEEVQAAEAKVLAALHDRFGVTLRR